MINVALLGFGTVGSGVAEVLSGNSEIIRRAIGEEVNIKYILDLREFPNSPFGHLVTHDFNTVLNDPSVSVVAEMMGGSHPAYDFTKACLEAGKSVVTSNKEVVANFGGELLEIASAHKVAYKFEASVGGGIPIIRPMTSDLNANRILSINGILNGTTNYILTGMQREGADYASVLADAQKLGYAEANPAADVDGIDAARKIVILAALAYGKMLAVSDVKADGIRNITLADFERAESLGYTLKLIAHAELIDGKILANVAPRLVPTESPLAGVADVFNGILIDTDMLGQVMFYGKGAGKLPTASAVVSDITDIAAHGCGNNPAWTPADACDIADADKVAAAYMLAFDKNIDAVKKIFNAGHFYITNGTVTLITENLTDNQLNELISECGAEPISKIKIL